MASIFTSRPAHSVSSFRDFPDNTPPQSRPDQYRGPSGLWSPRKPGRHAEAAAPSPRDSFRTAGSGSVLPPSKPPVSPPPDSEEPVHVVKRFSSCFTPDSVEQARRIIFGYTPPQNCPDDRPIESPLKGQFNPKAHPKLMLYFMHSAMGEPDRAEAALSDFAREIQRQRAENLEMPQSERIPLDPKKLDESVVRGVVDDAINVLRPAP